LSEELGVSLPVQPVLTEGQSAVAHFAQLPLGRVPVDLLVEVAEEQELHHILPLRVVRNQRSQPAHDAQRLFAWLELVLMAHFAPEGEHHRLAMVQLVHGNFHNSGCTLLQREAVGVDCLIQRCEALDLSERACNLDSAAL